MSVHSFTAGNGDQIDLVEHGGSVVISAHNPGPEQPIGATLEAHHDAAFTAKVLEKFGTEPAPRAITPDVSPQRAKSIALAYLQRAAELEDTEARRERRIDSIAGEIAKVCQRPRHGEPSIVTIARYIDANYTRVNHSEDDHSEDAEAGA